MHSPHLDLNLNLNPNPNWVKELLLRLCPTRRREGAKLLLRGSYPQISQITADFPLLRVGITRSG